MSNSRGITTFILTLGLTVLIFTACETHPERERVSEATPTPAVGLTPSPAVTVTPVVALTTSEQEFMTHAAREGIMEVQLGNLAAQKASNSDVKQLGESMATAHSQLSQKLQQLASSLNVTLPQELNLEQQNVLSRLEKLSGKVFDRDYLKAVISDHTKDISEFERAASQVTNEEIKQFASEALPTLRNHLKAARELAGKLGVKAE
jgi:putative membrane protein